MTPFKIYCLREYKLTQNLLESRKNGVILKRKPYRSSDAQCSDRPGRVRLRHSSILELSKMTDSRCETLLNVRICRHEAAAFAGLCCSLVLVNKV